MTIRVLSFDFDGCLFNKNYIESKNKNVIESNSAFLNKIKLENQGFSKVYTLVGSNRQSEAVDKVNAYRKGSCFPAIEQVNDYLGAIHDPFLLADVFGDLPAGISYVRARDEDYDGKHEDWLFDESKVTVLYAQMHKIAAENPHESIIFDFYDDRGNGVKSEEDILEKLHVFYNESKELMPSNLRLRLHHYAGELVTPIAEIKGTGFIDENYRETVKDLSQQAVNGYNDGIYKAIHVAEKAEPKELKNRKAVSKDPLVLGAKADFTHALNKLLEKAQILSHEARKRYNVLIRKDAQNPEYQSYHAAAEAAYELHTSLFRASLEFYKNPDKALFKKSTDEAIEKALNSELKNHRGHLKHILNYAMLAVLVILSVATLGLAYAIAGGIHYAINREFFFSTKMNTDSVNKVLDMKEAVGELSACSRF